MELSTLPQVVSADGRANSGIAAGLRRDRMSIGTIILIILVIALLGGFSGIGGGPFYGTGYYGGGGLGLIIVILLILILLGRILPAHSSPFFRDAPPNSGFPEFGDIIVQLDNSRPGCADRNPYSGSCYGFQIRSFHSRPQMTGSAWLHLLRQFHLLRSE